MSDQALIDEALRVYRRYQVEVVEEFGLCPWAARARREGRIAERVLLISEQETSALLSTIDELDGQRGVEIGLVVLPRLDLDRKGFDRFVSQLVQTDAARREQGSSPFAMAGFHPEALPDTSDPERLIPFIRRTPDPTIQLVRMEALERVREGFSEGTAFFDIRFLDGRSTVEDTLPLRERIARANLRIIQRAGVDRIAAILDAIRRDRDAAYARLEATRR